MNTNTKNKEVNNIEKGGNRMLYTSKIHYENIFKILNHEEVEGDDKFTPKNFISAFRRYIKEEVYGDGLYLLSNTLTRDKSNDVRCTGFVSNCYGQYVYFDSGDCTKPDWDKKIKLYITTTYNEIPNKNGQVVNLEDLGWTIKKLIMTKENVENKEKQISENKKKEEIKNMKENIMDSHTKLKKEENTKKNIIKKDHSLYMKKDPVI